MLGGGHKKQRCTTSGSEGGLGGQKKVYVFNEWSLTPKKYFIFSSPHHDIATLGPNLQFQLELKSCLS